jgi:hypothetical protein
MVANTYFILSGIAVFLLFHHVDAYWTVREKSAPREDGIFWAELTKIEFDGNDSSEIRCRVNTNPFQDKESIIYGNKPSYHGCAGMEKVSLHGSNRVLHHLTVLDTNQVLNCALAEKTSIFKEYICGNTISAVQPIDEVPVSASVDSASGNSASGNSASRINNEELNVGKNTVTYIPSSTDNTSCIAGYREKKHGNGPTGACCSYSDDCLDTCVQGVCGTAP